MNIKKIIQEEISDFDWVKDVPIHVTSCDQLEVGDRVMVTSNHDEIGAVNQRGTISSVSRVLNSRYTIKFDTRFSVSLHDSKFTNEDPTESSWVFGCENLGTTDIVTLID